MIEKYKNLKEMKITKSPYERAGTVDINIVFEIIKKHFDTKGKVKDEVEGHLVTINSLRLKSFLHNGLNCACCDAQAKYFAIERDKNSTGNYHLNLYGLDNKGNEVMFTHDHILARSLDGEDNLENTRTACGPCNWKKGRIEFFLKTAKNEEEINFLNEEMKKYFPQKKEKKLNF